MTELEFLRNRVSTLDSTLETAVSELRAMLDRSNAHLKPALRHSNDAERRIREARGHIVKLLDLIATDTPSDSVPHVEIEAREWVRLDGVRNTT